MGKLNNISLALGDLIDTRLNSVLEALNDVKGLGKELGVVMSGNESFKFAYDRAKERYGDTQEAKEKTFDLQMFQLKENSFYLKVRKERMDRAREMISAGNKRIKPSKAIKPN
jgi:hypothetical protein